MRRHLVSIALLLLLCAGLLSHAQACTQAAAQAFVLWWDSVLPALFPFYLCTSLLLQQSCCPRSSRLLRRPAAVLRLPEPLPPCCALGAVAGYPTGRGCAPRSASRPVCHIATCAVRCSWPPSIDIRIVTLPLCIAHYGSALLLVLLSPRPLPSGANACQEMDSGARGGIIRMVGDGMSAMLQIGGCICLFAVLSELLQQLGVYAMLDGWLQRVGVPAGLTAALLHGLLEFTGGCAAVAALPLPPRAALACCAFLSSFGGFCVYLQTRLFVEGGSWQYLLTKLVQGLLAALLAALLAPAFLPADATAMSQSAETYLGKRPCRRQPVAGLLRRHGRHLPGGAGARQSREPPTNNRRSPPRHHITK